MRKEALSIVCRRNHSTSKETAKDDEAFEFEQARQAEFKEKVG